MDQHVEGTRRLWVSDLLYHEVANALRYKPDFNEKKLSGAVEELYGLQLNTRSVDPEVINKASAIAYKGDLTIYDAVPVALAQIRGTVCITADEQTQYKKLKPHGYPVTLLSKEPIDNP
jgi:predicted nucleic acid-binding protein